MARSMTLSVRSSVLVLMAVVTACSSGVGSSSGGGGGSAGSTSGSSSASTSGTMGTTTTTEPPCQEDNWDDSCEPGPPVCPSHVPQPLCQEGETRPCYDGTAGTEGQGACHGGTRTCLPGGTAFTECEGQRVPAPTTCAAPVQFTCGDGPSCSAPRALILDDQPDGAFLRATAAAVDHHGNLLVAVSGLDAASVGTATLTKRDPSGAVLWTRSFRAPSSSDGPSLQIQAVAVGADDRVVIGGGFEFPSLDLGGGEVGDGAANGFVAQFDAAGHPLWSKAFHADGLVSAYTSFVTVNGLALDDSGAVHLAGAYGGGPGGNALTLDLGGGVLGGDTYGHGFVAKLDATGAHLWSHLVDGALRSSANAVAVDATGTLYVTGSAAYATGDTLPDGTACDHDAILLASYDAAGQERWSKTFGSARSGGSGAAVTVAPDGGVYVAGTADQGMDFGDGPLPGDYPVVGFVARFGAQGARTWTRGFAYNPPVALALDGAGNLVIAGDVGRVVKLQPSGAIYQDHWLSQQATFGVDALALQPDGAVVLAGSYWKSVDLGLGPTPFTQLDRPFVLTLDP